MLFKSVFGRQREVVSKNLQGRCGTRSARPRRPGRNRLASLSFRAIVSILGRFPRSKVALRTLPMRRCSRAQVDTWFVLFG